MTAIKTSSHVPRNSLRSCAMLNRLALGVLVLAVHLSSNNKLLALAECNICGEGNEIGDPLGEVRNPVNLRQTITCFEIQQNEDEIGPDLCDYLPIFLANICECRPVPTPAPVTTPTKAPTKSPTDVPTPSPTKAPTKEPTKAPTVTPSAEPTTSAPTFSPTPPPPTPEPTREPSPPTPTPFQVPQTFFPLPTEEFCFSALNKVEVQGKGLVPISKLEIGDRIRAGNDAFSPVLGFGKRQHDKIAQYLQLFSEGLEDTPLELTNDHMVFASGKFVAASEVRVGDMLGKHRVVAIKEVLRRGAYAPVTESGDLVVGGVLASCYTSMLDYSLFDRHAAFHAFMAPFRAGWISRWSYDEDRAVWIREWCPRLSSLKYVLSPLMQYLVSLVVLLIYVVSGVVWLVEGVGPMMLLFTLSLGIAGYRLYGGGRSKVKGL